MGRELDVIPLAGMIFSLSMNCLGLAAERFEMEVDAGKSFHEAQPAALNAALIPHVNSLFALRGNVMVLMESDLNSLIVYSNGILFSFCA